MIDFILHLWDCFYSSLQPPFIMEKWCTGIVEEMKIDCTVRFEVSCQREREKEREKKNTLKLPFIKGLSLTFPLFIFFSNYDMFLTLEVFNRFSTVTFFLLS